MDHFYLKTLSMKKIVEFLNNENNDINEKQKYIDEIIRRFMIVDINNIKIIFDYI